MKGIILAGGTGSRLQPLTKVTSKQLLPVYDRPMIMHPLETLLKASIRDILIIVAPDHAGDFLKLLGSGKEYGARFTYEIQDKPEGLAQAFLIGSSFIGKDNVCLILGDNIFEDDFSKSIKKFRSGAQIYVKKVSDPHRFGVVKVDKKMKAIEIIEKPKHFISNFVQTGIYLYDNQVVRAVRNQKPSERGELEITDLNNWYLKRGELKVEVVKGEWVDAGTFDSLFKASQLGYRKSRKKK
jgi:glucose-1-phosphate thymidylyltransferase